MNNPKLIYTLLSDLVLVLVLTALSVIFTLLEPYNQTPLRVILSLPILLFLPGYALISAMFPKKDDLSIIERFSIGFGLSVAIFVFSGFALSVTSYKFRPYPLVLSLSVITMILVLVTFLLRWRVSEDERFSFDYSTIQNYFKSLKMEKKEPTEIEKALTMVLIISIIISSGMLAIAKLTFEEEKFSTLYILGEGGKADNYPLDLYLLEPESIMVGVENYEHSPVNYTLDVMLGGYLIDREKISLNHEEVWVQNFSFKPKHVGRGMKFQFLLFKEDLSEPYRSVHLWVNSSVNYNNLATLKSYSLSKIPEIKNGDMESTKDWAFIDNSGYFRGHFTKFYHFSENSTISGYITDSSTGLPIVDARVRVSNHYGYEKYNMTDERGYYAIKTIADHFWVESDANGYERNSVNSSVGDGEALILNIANVPIIPFNMTLEELSLLNMTIESLPLELPEWLFIVNGRITNSVTGFPIPDAKVNITTAGFKKGITTNDTGDFETLIIPGDLIVQVKAEGYKEKVVDLYASDNTTIDIALIPGIYTVKSYIGEKSTYGLLQNLFHTANAADVQAPPWFSIAKGYVLDNVTGSPVPNADVKIVNNYGFERFVTTDQSGYFETKALSGSSSIFTSAKGYLPNRTRSRLSGDTTISILMTPEKSIIRGYVSDNVTGEVIPNANIGVVVSRYSNRTRSDPTGYYKLNTTAGQTALRVDVANYFWDETEFYIDHGEVKTLDLRLDPIPSLSTISGYVYHGGTRLSGVKVIVSDHDRYERSTITDEDGYYEIEAVPGHLWLNVLPNIYAEEMELNLKSGQKVPLDIELKAFTEGLYQMECPSRTPIERGYYGGITQQIQSDEGLATLSFKISDSYQLNRTTGLLFKQVLLNGIVVWEDDVSGDEEWEQIEVPIVLDQGNNNLTLRLYAKEDSMNFPATVWWDDVRVVPITVITRESSTTFNILNREGKNNPPTDLYLGKPTQVITDLKNNEGTHVNYILQVRLGGVTIEERDIGLKDGQSWKQNISFIPNQIGNLLKLEFLLFKDTVTDEPYKSIVFWVPSDVDYEDLDILKEYRVSPLPVISNGDMESTAFWKYINWNASFIGGFSDSSSISPSHSYEISLQENNPLKEGSYGLVYQNITAEKYPSVVVLSFNVRDSYTPENIMYISKQVLLNGNILWEDDVAGDERWQHVKVPVSLISNSNKLELRVNGLRDTESFPITIWWDDLKIEPIHEVTKKISTEFYILDADGQELHPETIYLGEPFNFTVEIENNEQIIAEYILQVKLDGRLIKIEKMKLESGSKWERDISFTPEIVGDNLKLEFSLYKAFKGEKPYRSVNFWVSSELNDRNLSSLIPFELKTIPVLENEDMESQTGWLYEGEGGLTGGYTSYDSVSQNHSYSVVQYGDCKAGDYGSIYQEFTSKSYPGVLIVSFDVKDTYDLINTTNISKQVLLNDEIIWEDDVAGAEGWQSVNIPVYIISSEKNRLWLRVYSKGDVKDLDIGVYFDDVGIKSVSSVT